MTKIILAAPDLLAEPSLVAAAGPAGLKILRRCVDASDLLACAAAEPDAAVVISAGVPRLSSDLIGRIKTRSRAVIALVVNDQDEARVRAWGLTRVVRLADADATAAAIAGELNHAAGDEDDHIGSDDLAEGPDRKAVREVGVDVSSRTERVLHREVRDADAVDAEALDPGVFATGVWSRSQAGTTVAVWGPPGAPGRTCTAIGLAETLAKAGRDVLLVDADVHAASIAMMLGMVDEASGLIVACRHADNGTLSPRTLRACAREVRPGLAVLTGIPRPERWPDARAGALVHLWQACRSTFEITIIDVGADLEEESHGSVNPVLGGRRNAAARTALSQSDAVVCVCRADPLGLTRLALAYPGLVDAAPDASRVIGVVTRERRPGSWRQVRAAIAGAGLDDPVIRLEPVPDAVRRRLARGLLPSESGSHRRERAGLAALAHGVTANGMTAQSGRAA